MAVFVLVGAFGRREAGWGAVVGVVMRKALRVARGVGRTTLVESLLAVESVSELCDRLMLVLGTQTMALSREDACGVLVCAVGLAMCLSAMLARSVVGCVVPLLACVVGIPLWASHEHELRAPALASEMPGVFRTLSLALGSGETLAQAVEYVGDHEGGVAGAAFRSAALKLRCGMPVHEALEALVAELDAPGIDLLATALLISQRTGCPLRGLFLRSATLVERQGEFERMLSVKTAQVRLSVHIVSLLPLIMVCVLSLISADFQKGLLTGPGMVSISLAAAMDIAALLIIRHLMKGVL
jgi:tight adherence protein B